MILVDDHNDLSGHKWLQHDQKIYRQPHAHLFVSHKGKPTNWITRATISLNSSAMGPTINGPFREVGGLGS